MWHVAKAAGLMYVSCEVLSVSHVALLVSHGASNFTKANDVPTSTFHFLSSSASLASLKTTLALNIPSFSFNNSL